MEHQILIFTNAGGRIIPHKKIACGFILVLFLFAIGCPRVKNTRVDKILLKGLIVEPIMLVALNWVHGCCILSVDIFSQNV